MSSEETWFFEAPQAGTQWRLKVRERLYSTRSEFQAIEVLDTHLFGRVLALDAVGQTSERDEFFYHEMLVHPALLCHPAPRRVLVIGGGDGGALRRVLEHPVEEAVMAELDAQVVEAAKEYLPSVSRGAFQDERARLEITDGHRFLKASGELFDVIVVDAPDPVGPAKTLFSKGFYQTLCDGLTDDGVAVVQSESPLLMASQTANTHVAMRTVFGNASTYLGEVPLYPGSTWSYTLSAKGKLPSAGELRERFSDRGLETRYYSPELHQAMFTLPRYLDDFIQRSIERGEADDQHPFFPEAQGQTV